MKAKTKKEKELILSFDETEAEWLKDFIQNHPDLPNESSKDSEKREQLFNILKNFLEE